LLPGLRQPPLVRRPGDTEGAIRTIGPGTPPAGITERVGIPGLTRIAGSRCATPDACTFADDATASPRRVSDVLGPQWSRPVSIDGCSMVARMPRYAPAASGTRGTQRIPAAGQNGSSRHVLALFDSSLSRRIEQSSGLLIRGFGVRVPGGAPVLTWGFIAPGHFFVSVLSPVVAPWLLARTDPAIRVLSKTARPAPDPGSCGPRSRRHARPTPIQAH
jgi:hypothetical protein